jgi:hypothetical protein
MWAATALVSRSVDPFGDYLPREISEVRHGSAINSLAFAESA